MDAFKYARVGRFPRAGLERKGSEGNRISESIYLQVRNAVGIYDIMGGRDLVNAKARDRRMSIFP
jgi:hypothetical protein